MRSTLEPLEGNKVRLSVEVDEREFDRALDAAFRRIAREVRIPGFRPGKVPRRLLEARLGSTAAREEALRESLPEYYQQALAEHDVDPIAPPEIDITAGRESGPVAFDAVVQLRPQLKVPGYGGLRVTVPSPHADEREVEEQIDRLRDQFAELRTVVRPARDGDHVLMDRKVYRHEETLLAADDELYEVGRGSVAPELDEQLRGAKAGDILKFNAILPDAGEVTFQLLVKEVREKLLPEVTDEWAGDASEFETVEELRQDIRTRLSSMKRVRSAFALREQVIEALVDLVDEDMPEALVDDEIERRLGDLSRRLEEQGSDLAQYLQSSGRSAEDLREHLREHAVRAVKADLALRAVAESEGLVVTDEELEAEIAGMAERLGEKPDVIRRRLDHADQLPAVRSDIGKTKALAWLVEHAEIVDEEGRVIDRSDLMAPTSDAVSTQGEPA